MGKGNRRQIRTGCSCSERSSLARLPPSLEPAVKETPPTLNDILAGALRLQARHRRGTLHAEARDRPRRRRDGVSRARRAARAVRRDQGAARRAVARARRAAVPARDQAHGEPAASAHPPDPRFGRGGRPAVLRDAVRRGRFAAAAARVRTTGSRSRRRCGSGARWRARSPTRTSAASCIATSSRRTSSSPAVTPCVADFGIARAIDRASEKITQQGTITGTPAYMSPEQARDRAFDGRSDVYSLACVLYEAIAGVPPFPGDTPQQQLSARLTKVPAPLQRVPPRRARADRDGDREGARDVARRPLSPTRARSARRSRQRSATPARRSRRARRAGTCARPWMWAAGLTLAVLGVARRDDAARARRIERLTLRVDTRAARGGAVPVRRARATPRPTRSRRRRACTTRSSNGTGSSSRAT